MEREEPEFSAEEAREAQPVLGVWERLMKTEKPIVMYGMGDGAEKILSVMEEKGIRPAEFMASDEFVRGHSFRGYRVKRLSEIEAQYSDFLLVICFGTAVPEVMERVTALSEKYETVVPDVPVADGGLFDGAFLTSHESELQEVRSLFADERSLEVFGHLLRYRYTGDLSVLRAAESEKSEALSLLRIGTNEIYMDLGAYDGDTVEEFLRLTGKRFEKIYAVEPDRRNYAKMRRRLYSLGSGVFVHLNAAVTEEDGSVVFVRRSGRGAAVLGNAADGKTGGSGNRRTETVDGRSVDSILGGNRATIIKYDVEGSEEAALRGSAETIKSTSPA